MYLIGYNKGISYLVKQTELFEKWHGNLGDTKSIGNGISEMRIDTGAGYRVYFTLREKVIVILLTEGTKSSQQSDIKKAIQLAKEI